MARCFICSSRAKHKIKDDSVCPACWTRVGFPSYSGYQPVSASEFRSMYDQQIEYAAAVNSFPDEYFSLGHLRRFMFDDAAEKFAISYPNELDDRNTPTYRVFNYEDLLRVETSTGMSMETSRKSGIGRALVGGALFGVAGAIVGATTAGNSTTVASKETVTLTVAVGEDTERLTFPSSAEFLECLQRILDVGKDELEPMAAPSDTKEDVDEVIAMIRKIKQLLDEGILTEEEFTAKKKQLLGI